MSIASHALPCTLPGFIPDAQNDDEACPLHLAAQSGRIKSAKVLIEKDQSLINDDDEVWTV